MKILGAVLNKVKIEKSHYGKYYGNYYGHYYGSYYGREDNRNQKTTSGKKRDR